MPPSGKQHLPLNLVVSSKKGKLLTCHPVSSLYLDSHLTIDIQLPSDQLAEIPELLRKCCPEITTSEELSCTVQPSIALKMLLLKQ